MLETFCLVVARHTSRIGYPTWRQQSSNNLTRPHHRGQRDDYLLPATKSLMAMLEEFMSFIHTVICHPMLCPSTTRDLNLNNLMHSIKMQLPWRYTNNYFLLHKLPSILTYKIFFQDPSEKRKYFLLEIESIHTRDHLENLSTSHLPHSTSIHHWYIAFHAPHHPPIFQLAYVSFVCFYRRLA